MKKINIPLILLILFILLVLAIIFSVITGSSYTEIIVFWSFYFLPLSILILIVHKIFTWHINNKLFWTVLILDILFFIIFYLWFHAADNLMNLG
jgi:hypothetical protein